MGNGINFEQGGSAALTCAWAYFRLPEFKGRSFRELDILFSRRIPAAKFRTTVISEDEES
jgi:SP family general alpha glucoside:H+ symporter-like MFS transporter